MAVLGLDLLVSEPKDSFLEIGGILEMSKASKSGDCLLRITVAEVLAEECSGNDSRLLALSSSP